MNDTFLAHSGTFVTPLAPNPAQVHIDDIAHALSLICRGNGHYKYFYSVAQHCINCVTEARARGLSKRIQLACLMHDGSEAYLGDMVRPLKGHIEEYLEIEAKMQACVYAHFGIGDLTEEETAAVKTIDDAVLYHEFLVINHHRFDEPEPKIYGELDFAEKPHTENEKMFKELFLKLEQ